MKHSKRIEWMAIWAARNGVMLELNGECGFGRECVGIIKNNNYPDYHWYDDDLNRTDKNGDVWTPPNAYHKHPCVAVLGRGEKSETELYEWLKWFDKNGFTVESVPVPPEKYLRTGTLGLLMGRDRHNRMVRK